MWLMYYPACRLRLAPPRTRAPSLSLILCPPSKTTRVDAQLVEPAAKVALTALQLASLLLESLARFAFRAPLPTTQVLERRLHLFESVLYTAAEFRQRDSGVAVRAAPSHDDDGN